MNSPHFQTFFPHDVIWYENPLGQFGSAVLYLPPPSSVCPPRSPLAGRAVGEPEKTETALALCSTAWQQVKHHCVISIVLLLKPKHGTTPGTRKENNTVQAETNIHSLFHTVHIMLRSHSFLYVLIHEHHALLFDVYTHISFSRLMGHPCKLSIELI